MLVVGVTLVILFVSANFSANVFLLVYRGLSAIGDENSSNDFGTGCSAT